MHKGYNRRKELFLKIPNEKKKFDIKKIGIIQNAN